MEIITKLIKKRKLNYHGESPGLALESQRKQSLLQNHKKVWHRGEERSEHLDVLSGYCNYRAKFGSIG